MNHRGTEGTEGTEDGELRKQQFAVLRALCASVVMHVVPRQVRTIYNGARA